MGDPNNFKHIFMIKNVSCLKFLGIVLIVQKVWRGNCGYSLIKFEYLEFKNISS